VGKPTRPGGAPAGGAPLMTKVMTPFEMVRSGRSFRELPLRATTSVRRNPNGTLTVIGLFEPVDSAAKIMTAFAALFDENSRSPAYWNAQADTLTGRPTAFGLTVPPGTYRLRIAAIDSFGRLGLIDDQIVAELGQAGPVQVSGMMLGQSLPSGFAPYLAFTKQKTAVAYLELYGGTAGAEISVSFELASTTNGPASFKINGVPTATKEEGKYTVTGTIPVWALDPGDYVVRAIITVTGTTGRVIRTLHKAR